MAFDARAIENIATAPATRYDRIAAAWLIAIVVASFAAVVPLNATHFAPSSAVIPAVLSAAAFGEVLTAILLLLQYRAARQLQLGVLALTYGASSVLTLVNMLTFPGVFAPSGLFHANLQTSAWLSVFERENFGACLIAFACADRFGWIVPRGGMRRIALGFSAWVALLILLALFAPLPELVSGTHGTAFYFHVALTVQAVTALIAIALLATSGLRTVTQVWLGVVAVIYLCVTLANAALSGERFTLGWYAGRSFVFGGAIVILGVFLFKINEMVVRLSGRTSALAARTEEAESVAAAGELRYRSLANVVPQLIWTADARGEVDYVNDRWLAYTGLDLRDTQRRGWFAALDPRDAAEERAAWSAALRQERRYRRECRLVEMEGGRSRWFLVDVIPLHDENAVLDRWIASCTDIDRSKRAEEREAFLSAAGDRLSGSLDLSATIAAITGAAAEIAAWARLDLAGEDGRLPADLPPPDVPGGMTTLVVPLMAGNVSLAALTLADSRPGYPDDDDVALARDFGRRAALALDHARRYERERTTADSFQRAMLPYVLPNVENVSFSASYSAASESRRVGGDFYDAFMLPNGRVALTIGDVSGHGLEAAVVMGEIRQGLRAAASFEDASPSAILDRASRLLVGSGRSVFVTAVFGVLDTRRGRFKYATAGHAPPLVYTGNDVLRLPGAGLPLGLRDGEGVDFALSLEPGSTLVMYTDGLIEFGRDLAEGERRLEAAIRSLDGVSAGAAGAIMQRVLGDDQATDDIAILTATIGAIPEQPPMRLRAWRFDSNDERTAHYVRHEAGVLIAEWTGDEGRRFDGELAFGEVFSNVVRHAPGPVRVRLEADDANVVLSVADSGRGFPGEVRPAPTLAESGRGLHLVREIADGLTIEPAAGGGTLVRVRFNRARSTSLT